MTAKTVSKKVNKNKNIAEKNLNKNHKMPLAVFN